MRHFAAFTLTVILASVALTAGAFASNAASVHDMAGHGASSCLGTGCGVMPAAEDSPSVDCIAHCLQASSAATSATTPTIIATMLAIVATIASWRKIAQWLAAPGTSDAIAAFVRKRAVATVVLRN